MKDKNVQITRRPPPIRPLCNTGYYYSYSKVILPVIGTVTHAIQYGTTVTVQGIKDLILLAESLL